MRTAAKKEAIVLASWWLATCIGSKVGIRDARNLVHTDSKNNQYYLSSVIRDDQKEETSEFTLDGFRQTLEQPHRDNETVVIQLLEDFEEGVLNALPVGKDEARKIDVSRLNLVDFSHALCPTEDFQDAFNGLYRAIQDKNLTDSTIVVHCKAGVNRSFRIISALVALDKLKNEGDEHSCERVAEAVWETMHEIKNIRSCVDFSSHKRVLEQFSFVATLVAGNLGLDKKAMASCIYKFVLTKYINNLDERDDEYSSIPAQLVSYLLPENVGPQPRTNKLKVARSLLDANSKSTVFVGAAGHQGKLGDIVQLGLESGVLTLGMTNAS